jgi:lipopolysaccharide export system protein LptA
MPLLFPDRCGRGTVTGLLSLVALLHLQPGYSAAAQSGEGEIQVASRKTAGNGNDGTLMLDDVVLTRKNPGMLIKATRAEASGLVGGSYANSHWVLSGKVHVEYEKFVMDAESATVVFANGLVRSIDVHGTPAQFSHAGKVAGRPYRGSSPVIAFEAVKRQVRFTGRSWYSSGPFTGNSDKPVIYELDSGSFWSENVGNPGATMTMTIQVGEREIQADYQHLAGNGNDGTLTLDDVVLTARNPGMLIKATRAEASGLASGGVSNGQWILNRKVHIEYEKVVLDAETATVGFVDDMIRRIEVHGMPARFSHPLGNYEGSGETIVFDGEKRRVLFKDKLRYRFGVNEGSSDLPLLYDLDNRVLSSVDDGNPGSRIRATIQPERKLVPTPSRPGRSTAQ